MNKKWKLIFTIATYLYIFILLTITVFRPWRGPIHFMQGYINWKLFTNYIHIIKGSLWLFCYLFFGNIVWFIPYGFYEYLVRERTMRKSIALGFFLSLLIEVMQYVLGRGDTEIDDLILNTFGCFIGCLMAMAVKKVIEYRKKSKVDCS